MADLLAITLDDMIGEVRRECARRRDVFGRMAREGHMNARSANQRIGVMDAVLHYLEQQREREGEGDVGT